MPTRSIVTSQPDIACDVCERRLLRGEQFEVFLAAGRRRTVCELCAPRAVHEGWLRETDDHPVSAPVAAPRRRRNLFDRLRQVGRPDAEVTHEAPAEQPAGREDEGEPTRVDFLDDLAAGAERSRPVAARKEGEIALSQGGSRSEGGSGASAGLTDAERAIEVFNASEHPRRIAGVARSLGAPEVNVRPDEDVEDLVVIVIAWELCWYRYEVQLYEGDAAVRLLAQGSDLRELAGEDRLANAVAQGSGALVLAADVPPSEIS